MSDSEKRGCRNCNEVEIHHRNCPKALRTVAFSPVLDSERSPERHEYQDGAGDHSHTYACGHWRQCELRPCYLVAKDFQKRCRNCERTTSEVPDTGRIGGERHEGFEWLPEKECHGVKAVYRCRKCNGEVIQIPSSADVFSGHVCAAPQPQPEATRCPMHCEHDVVNMQDGVCRFGWSLYSGYAGCGHRCAFPAASGEPSAEPLVHPEPEGEDSGGAYHMMTIAEATKELIGVVERDRMAAKPTAWYSLAIKDLIQRIVNLRALLAAKAAATPLTGEAAEICAEMAREAEAKMDDPTERGWASFSARANALREAERRIREYAARMNP